MNTPNNRTNPGLQEQLRLVNQVIGSGDFRRAEVMLRDLMVNNAGSGELEAALGFVLLGRRQWWEGAQRLCRSLTALQEAAKKAMAGKLKEQTDHLATDAEKRGQVGDSADLRALGEALQDCLDDPLKLAAHWLPKATAPTQYAVLYDFADWLHRGAAPDALTPEQMQTLLQLAAEHGGYKQLVPMLCEALVVQARDPSTNPPLWGPMLQSMIGLAGGPREMGMQFTTAFGNSMSRDCFPSVQQQFIHTITRRLLPGDSPYNKETSEAYLDFCRDLHPDGLFDTPVSQVQRLWSLYSVDEGDRAWQQARGQLLIDGPGENPGRPEALVDDPLLLHQYRSTALAQKQEIERAVAAPYCDRIERLAQARKLAPVYGAGSGGAAGPLRVGYLTASAYRHSMGFILQGMLHNHGDAVRVTVYDSDNQQRTDSIAQGIRQAAADYRRIDLRSIEAARQSAEQIAADGIDILVDLEGACQPGYAGLHYFRPAPVSCAYAGADSAGIRFIDYYLADRWCLHEQAADYYVEKPFALPRFTYVLAGYEPVGENARQRVRERLGVPQDAVVYLIAAPGHKITRELSEDVLQVLSRVPGSMLLVKGRGNAEWTRDFWGRRALEQGVDPQRIRYPGFAPTNEEHRMELAAADLILDTFPYNGASHSFEALWCGTPVITRYGETFMSRMSYSMLKNLNLPQGIAADRGEYVEKAVALGLDHEQRRELRQYLLQSALERSAIWDARGIAGDLEQALLAMGRAGRPGAAS
jgi:hypothetical protein